MNIPLSSPDMSEADIDAVVAVLRSNRLSLGPKMEEFEELVSHYVRQPYGIAVSSGTAGLHLCIRALGIGPGDEVILPSFTFIAAANAVRYEGATPVFIDIEALSLNLDPDRIEEAITSRTRAIIAVHTFGVPANMDAILALAKKHNLRVIEDACEALGAEYKGGRVGSFGDAAVFAFYPNKQITTGEGGMIVTADASLAREMRAMRNQGRYETDAWHQHSILGFNYRLSEISCALGCEQMRRIDSFLAQREQVATFYQKHLVGIPELILPQLSYPDSRLSWFVYVVQLSRRFNRSHRDEIMGALHAQGIGCGRYFAPIHAQPAYSSTIKKHPLPVTDSVSDRTLALPFFNRLREEEIAIIGTMIDSAVALTLDTRS